MEKTNQRIDWIDIAKGFGMIMVMIGHIPSNLYSPFSSETYFHNLFIYSFHVPLFFFLSGLTFSNKQISKTEFLKKKVKSLIIPYICFSVIYIAIEIVMALMSNELNGKFLLTEIKNYFWYTNQHAIWFLPCLFIVELLHYVIKELFNNNKVFIIAGVLFSVMALVMEKFTTINFPFKLSQALIMYFLLWAMNLRSF